MNPVYLDNAATTSLDPEVIKVMSDCMRDVYGNPSSSHNFGRKSRSVIEESRRKIAYELNAESSEIFFTSGGTEADNMAIRGAVRDGGVKHIITSKLEHPAVLNTVNHLRLKKKVIVSYLNTDKNGIVDLSHLEQLLSENDHVLVSLMHGNNEIGNLINLESVSILCRNYNALFHSDTVQTVGHYKFDLKKTKIDFLACSAHKFHGPKGIGFLYINKDINITPLIHGGSQERNMRGGTECLYGIAGLAKAIEVAYKDLEKHYQHIYKLKQYMIKQVKEKLPFATFNGQSGDLNNSLFTVLSISFPKMDYGDLLLFNLDLMGVSCSGGSACSSGNVSQSHVISEIEYQGGPVVRFSFGKFNTKDDVDLAINSLVKLFT
ncbi:MAG: cysteine desulfurase [Flavobacteriales bacterium]|nr:cysteine desulfurase [Flavobacteriales bacterium]|tara:strand:+ start:798 stop:1928 length:1131 start_codon:yes stop_codon:yes gene_type:complete